MSIDHVAAIHVEQRALQRAHAGFNAGVQMASGQGLLGRDRVALLTALMLQAAFPVEECLDAESHCSLLEKLGHVEYYSSV